LLKNLRQNRSKANAGGIRFFRFIFRLGSRFGWPTVVGGSNGEKENAGGYLLWDWGGQEIIHAAGQFYFRTALFNHSLQLVGQIARQLQASFRIRSYQRWK
jgi:hypothetical protein